MPARAVLGLEWGRQERISMPKRQMALATWPMALATVPMDLKFETQRDFCGPSQRGRAPEPWLLLVELLVELIVELWVERGGWGLR